MKSKKFFVLVFVCFLLVGCAALKATLKDIANNPSAFVEDTAQVSGVVTGISPTLTGVGGTGLGGLIVSALWLLNNWKKKKGYTVKKMKGKFILYLLGFGLFWRMVVGALMVAGAICLTL